VVAEGVENRHQMDTLIQMNCDVMQGYLFARPLPASRIPALLRMGVAPGLWPTDAISAIV
jgi:EAL domain-containing protein (putative c-di-GMP-specific phosphodiesterase class I)